MEKPLTKKYCDELASITGKIFRGYEGRLDPCKYELLDARTEELGEEGYDVSIFQRVLNDNLSTYEIRSGRSNTSP